jgi:hypothetical protein
MPANVRWILLEGILPLFGASVLYLCWGVIRSVTEGNASFKFGWREALDSFGWLYGAAVIAAQSAKKSFTIPGGSASVAWMNVFAGIVCVLALISGMTSRGEKAGWKPPKAFHLLSIALTLTILIVGFFAVGGEVSVTAAEAAGGKK